MNKLEGFSKGAAMHNHALGNDYTLKDAAQSGFAQFNIKVERIGANIASPLDVAIFGYLYFIEGYTGVISQTLSGLSSGINGTATADNSTLDNLEALVLTYDNGAATDDVVKITSSSAASYPAFLGATVSDVFACAGIRQNVPTAQAQLQQSEELVIKRESIFGKEESNRISPSAFVNPDQNQSGIVDIPLRFNIDKTTVIKTRMIEAEFTMTLSFFVDQAKRFNSEML